MLRSVWFSPTVEESDAGADWFRCDVIAVAADDELAALAGARRRTRRPSPGATATRSAAPPSPTPGFERVICSAEHTWEAIASGAVPRGVPRRGAGQDAGEPPARTPAARRRRPPGLHWSYEWPTASSGTPASPTALLGPSEVPGVQVGVIATSPRDPGSYAGHQPPPCPPHRVSTLARPRPSVASLVTLARAQRAALVPRASRRLRTRACAAGGVALPVLGDLDPQVEVDRRAQQRLDLLAGGGADVAQPGPLVADHDALLGVALDVQVGVDVEQRLVVGPVLTQPHLLDHDGDRVRQLVADALQGGLPDQLRDDRLLGRVAQVAVRVELRPLGQQPDQQVLEQLHLVAGLRRHRDDLGPLDAGLDRRAPGCRAGAARSARRSRGRSWWRSRPSWSASPSPSP